MNGPVLLPFDPLAPLAERSLVLEASAGTGKTYSIASLFVRLVVEEEALEPREILLVTFTEAATAELRERIRARLRDTQEALSAAMRTGEPPDGGDRIAALLAADGLAADDLPRRVRRVRRALECFAEITISTIHGFCRRMLQQNAFESGADFDTELVADLSGVVADAVTDFLAEETYDLPPEALDWIDAAGGRERLSELASKVVRDPDLAVLPLLGPDPVAWEGFETAVAGLRGAWDADGGGRGALAAVLDAGARKCFLRNRFRAGWFSGWHAAADAWIAAGCPLSRVPEHLSRLSASDLVAACERGAAPSHPVFDRVQDVLDRAEGARRHVAGWRARMHRALADRVRRRVEEHKRLHHATTFDDLLRDLRDALEGDRGDALRAAIARLFKVALIDEFQDTDPVQWGVFRRVFGRPDSRLYLIGDPKQAIYGFRRADIETYLAARAEVGQGRTLDANWRSDGPLVHALNRLYEACPAPFLRGDIACPPVRAGLGDPVVRIRFPATGDWAPVRVAVVGRTRPAPDALPGAKDAKPLSKEAATERAVAFTASDVAAFLAGAEIRDADLLRERPETGGWRRARPGDTAVLVRYNWQGEAVQRALRAAGIPGVRAGHDDVMASDEARDLARALAAVLSPDDRRAVRTGLATPLFGNTAADLDALDADEAAADAPRDALAALAEEWRGAGFMAMFRRLLHDRGVAARLLAWKDGERRMTNLLHAAELLHAEESGGGRGPLSLIQWLREQIAAPGGGDAETRLLRLESDADAVQIVTIHSCKGLQYKAVWCPFLWDGRLLSKRDAALPRFHRDGGMAVDTVADGPDFAAHLAAAEREAFEENLRLAYVAMTRAERVCTVVTGRISGVDTSPLGVLLHWKGDPAGASDLGAIRSAVSALSAGDLRAQVATLAAASVAPGTGLPSVALQDVPADDPPAAGATARPPLPPGAPPLAVREWTGRAFDRAWRRTSFSGMVRGGEELPDPDAEVEPPAIDEGDPAEGGASADESGVTPGDTSALLADVPGGAAIG
ncbi:MAG: UvrD-helicase domain-containing protein, partial [Deltaproteobacteria bacterium]|nr:UvrD-helicase domain-containing protein [Deltaproteobacteria bacterium]